MPRRDGLLGGLSRAASSAGHVRRVTLGALGVNLALAALKFAAGVLGASQALIADAVHSL